MKPKEKAAKKYAAIIEGYAAGFANGVNAGREVIASEILQVLGSARHLGERNLSRYADALLAELEDNLYELKFPEEAEAEEEAEEEADKDCPEGFDKSCAGCECAA
ncbi:hypothetical protein [Propionivibrio sp.]|uniref:hypothetical protein n=1 Tax=Propionivibrio sp. TaxID=2212460 RepID=UPI003BF213FF